MIIREEYYREGLYQTGTMIRERKGIREREGKQVLVES